MTFRFHSGCRPRRAGLALPLPLSLPLPLVLALVVSTTLWGCGQGGSAPVTAVPRRPTPQNLGKIVVIRPGAAVAEEPTEKDLRDGLSQEGLVEGTSYTLQTLDAGGDASRLPGLVDDAVKGGAAILITLGPEATRLAADRAAGVPVVGYTGIAPPAALGLSTASTEQKAHVTGTFASLARCNLVAVACGCVPADRRRLGIVVDPADPVSVALKDALLAADHDILTAPPKFEVAEVRAASGIPAAVQDLARRQAAALLLIPGQAIDEQALIQEATRAKLPVFGYRRAQALAGAALVRVPNLRWSGFETGRRAARVLNGTDAHALPFLEGVVFGTVANPPAAKKLGMTIRGEFLRTAEVLP